MPDPQLPQAPQIPQAQNPRGIVPADPNRVKSVLGFFTDPHPLGNGAELDRGPLGNSAIRVLDLIARAGGASSPIEGAMARYQQGVQQRKAQFTQNLEMLGRLGGVLEELPLSRRGGAAEQLRKRFSADFGGPGSEVLFDAVLGDLELAPGVLSQLQKDPEIRGLLANPLASGADLEAIASSPEFRERAVARQDVELLPSVDKKLRGWFQNPPPELRSELEQFREGGITVAEIRRLNELAGQGPAGGALTPAELSTLERRQGDIAARFPNFVTTSAFEAKQKADAEFEDFQRRHRVEQAGRERLKQMERKTSGSPTETSQLGFARDVRKRRSVYEETISQVQRAVDSPLDGVGDIQALYQFIARQDNTAAREGELDLAQRAASALGRLERITGNIADGRLLDDDARQKMRRELEGMLNDTRKLRDEFVMGSADIAKQFGIEEAKIVPDIADFRGAKREAVGGRAKESPRQATQEDVDQISEELGTEDLDQIIQALEERGLTF